jgi:hypothetical protein
MSNIENENVEGQQEQTPVIPDPALGDQNVEGGSTSKEESFTDFDMNSVPEAEREIAEKYHKLFQKDYTPKMQEIAPARKLIQRAGSIDELETAYNIYSNLNSDDPAVFAQVNAELEKFLEERKASSGSNKSDSQEQDLSGLDESDPVVKMLKEQKAELDQFKKELAQNSKIDQARQLIEKDQAELAKLNPEFFANEKNVERLYNFANGANCTLKEAYNEVSDLVQSGIKGWATKKTTTPTGPSGVGSGSSVGPNVDVTKLSEEDADKLAVARLKALNAQGE